MNLPNQRYKKYLDAFLVQNLTNWLGFNVLSLDKCKLDYSDFMK